MNEKLVTGFAEQDDVPARPCVFLEFRTGEPLPTREPVRNHAMETTALRARRPSPRHERSIFARREKVDLSQSLLHLHNTRLESEAVFHQGARLDGHEAPCL